MPAHIGDYRVGILKGMVISLQTTRIPDMGSGAGKINEINFNVPRK
jgi:hypothetical protein